MSGPQRYQRRSDLVSQRPLTTALAVAVLLGCAGPAVADSLDDLGTVIAGVRAAVADGRVTQSKLLGFENRKGDFTESPSEPGVLTGFDLGVGKWFDIETIYAYRGVFQTAHGDEELSEHGLFRNKVGPKNKRIKTKVRPRGTHAAQPGYAVGAMTFPHSGLLINGLSVTFMRMKDGKLDPQQSYESNWVGDRTGGGETTVGGDGAPVVGISGSQDDEHASTLGLTFTTDPAPAARSARPSLRRPSFRRRPFRPPSGRRSSRRQRGNRRSPRRRSRIRRPPWPTRPPRRHSRRLSRRRNWCPPPPGHPPPRPPRKSRRRTCF